jgi:antitoxin component of MazEF toxin-antitoxin module
MTSRKLTVKAREHHGTGSLDLTLPAILVRKHNVQIGDVFEISVSSKNGELRIIYKRVYAQART